MDWMPDHLRHINNTYKDVLRQEDRMLISDVAVRIENHDNQFLRKAFLVALNGIISACGYKGLIVNAEERNIADMVRTAKAFALESLKQMEAT